MTFLRPLHVVATVAVLAVVGMGCTVEDDGGSFSASQTVGQPASEGSSGSSGGSGGTTVAGSSVGTTAEAVSSSTGEPGTTVEPGTTIEPTTAGDPTTGSATTGETTTGVGTTTGNPGGCGDGAINGNEQCDGANLNGFTCEALGNMGGTLQCDPVTCTFDTQLCEVGGGDTSGTSG